MVEIVLLLVLATSIDDFFILQSYANLPCLIDLAPGHQGILDYCCGTTMERDPLPYIDKNSSL